MPPCIKRGHTPGFRGRQTPARLDRRMHYLASEHGRTGVVLSGASEQDLTIEQAIEALGGPEAEYTEYIIAPSRAECEAIRSRCPENPKQEALATGHRIGRAFAQGRCYVLVMHEQDGRFHFHLDVQGPERAEALGRHGHLQKAWDQEFRTVAPQIRDWEAHQRFKGLKAELEDLIHQQRANDQQRMEAVRSAAPNQKLQAARPFEGRARELVERRYTLELATMEARYEARGCVGSPEHRVEQEQAAIRRVTALNRLEARNRDRQAGQNRDQGREPDQSPGRGNGARRASVRVAAPSLDLALREMGVDSKTRTGVRVSLSVASEASQATLKMAMEASRAALASSVHLTRASAGLVAGVLGAPLTGGEGLQVGLREAGREFSAALAEAGKGVIRSGEAAGKGLVTMAGSTTRGLASWELRAASDMISGRPMSGVGQVLPDELRRAFQLAGVLPGSSVIAALRMAEGMGRGVQNSPSGGREVDR